MDAFRLFVVSETLAVKTLLKTMNFHIIRMCDWHCLLHNIIIRKYQIWIYKSFNQELSNGEFNLSAVIMLHNIL